MYIAIYISHPGCITDVNYSNIYQIYISHPGCKISNIYQSFMMMYIAIYISNYKDVNYNQYISVRIIKM